MTKAKVNIAVKALTLRRVKLSAGFSVILTSGREVDGMTLNDPTTGSAAVNPSIVYYHHHHHHHHITVFAKAGH
jgi:hypothetical protein